MDKEQQLKKNLKLISKLLDYLAKYPDIAKTVPTGSSYVVFSSKDEDLNIENEKLAKNLLKKGKKVVKVTNIPGKTPWQFAF